MSNTPFMKSYKEDNPYFKNYVECMSRAFLKGMATFSLSFGGFYTAQSLLNKSLPYSFRGYIAVSTILSSALAYKITSIETKFCQDAWMAGEDKHTYLNPISTRIHNENDE